MSAESSPEQLERVRQLAEAINQKKRLESDDTRSTAECLRADEGVQQALEDVRRHHPGTPLSIENTNDESGTQAN